MIALFYVCVSAQSQQILKAGQTTAVKQQNKAGDKATPSNQEQQPTPPTKITLEGPITVVNQPDPKQDQRDANEHAQTRFANSIQIGTLVFVALAAAGAVGAWWANRRSAKAAESQVELLRSEVEAAQAEAIKQRGISLIMLEETRKTANAAKKSARVAEKALIATQRPFISLNHYRWLWHDDWGRPNRYWYSIHPVIQNTGPIPTRNMMIAVQYDLRDSPFPEGFDFPITNPPRPSFVAPQTVVEAQTYTLNDDVLQEIQRGAKILYIWGVIDYRDFFDTTPIHTTKFCARISNVLGTPLHPPLVQGSREGSSVEITFEIYGEHNSDT